MKQFVEFLPIAVFAGVYFYTRDIFISTTVLIVATLCQIAFEYGSTKTVSRQTLFVFFSVVVLGGMTIAFRDEIFIQETTSLTGFLVLFTPLIKKITTEKMLEVTTSPAV